MDQRGPPHNAIAIQKNQIYLFPESACAIHTHTANANKILLIEQWRPTHGIRTLELPGGRVEAGENPEKAAERELLEEAGVVANGSRYILKLDLDLSTSVHCTHLVHTYSSNLPENVSNFIYLDVDLAWQRVLLGEITHAPTVAAILLILSGRFNFG